MAHDLKGKMVHCFCQTDGDYTYCCVCKYKIWNSINQKKAFAVGILAKVWSGAQLPPSMVEEAERIQAEMKADGTWMPA